MSEEQQEKAFWKVTDHVKQIWALIVIFAAIILIIWKASVWTQRMQSNETATQQNVKDIQNLATKESLKALQDQVNNFYKEFQQASSNHDDAIDEIKDNQIKDEGIRDGRKQVVDELKNK